MTINPKLVESLRWYRELGIDMAVGKGPRDHYMPAKEIPSKQAQGPDLKKVSLSSRPQPLKMPGPSASTTQEMAARCQSLAELRQAMESFEECPLKLTATNLVFSAGNPKAKVMLVGEAPGADEDRQGLPFVGLSGQLLDRMLATIGLDRTSVYITNIVPWRPPGNRQPTTQEIALCQPFVERHIELVHPQILVLVGAVSMKALLKTNEGIMRVRGIWRPYTSPGLEMSIQAIATYHPAFLLRSPGQKAQSWRDFLMIKKALSG